jgi:hypothetical protein
MEIRVKSHCLLSLFILLWLSGCSTQNEDVVNEQERLNHGMMVSKLDSIIADARQEPLKYFYANEFRLAYLDSLVQANPEVPQLEYRYAMEFQNSRELEKSIPILRELGTFMTDPVSQKMVNEALAISYLRLAEVNNCIENYTPSNCILPFDEEAVHQNKSYIRSSIIHIEKLFEEDPANYTYHWIYNIAHIANGSYPDSVQADFLIPGLQEAETLPEDLSVPFFKDIGMMSGAGDNRISGSSCVDDFNGNGHLDIFATSYGFGDRVVFYVNDGNGKFTDQATAAGLDGIMGGLNIECADINNSGFTDVLILRGAWLARHGEHPNSLLRNNGDGTFTDITIASGLYEAMPTQVAAFADLNHNGYLDLFIGNESSSPWQAVFTSDEESAERYPSAIFLNNGDETFLRYENLNGFELEGFVKGASWGDINRDGWPDLFVSLMGDHNKLFVHRGLDDDGLPVFDEISREAGVQQPQFSFPAWFFDYNNNGLDDLLVITYDVRAINRVGDEIAREKLGLPVQTEFSRLYENMGDETFRDVTEEAGLNKVMFGMGANFADLNNNGYPDIYIGTGAPDLASIIPNRLFLNHNGTGFHESTAYSGVGHLQKGHGVSMADFNGDGMIDIYAVLGGAVEGDYYHNALFENQVPSGNWLMLELEGVEANRQAIGAKIEAVLSEGGRTRRLYRTVSTGGSFGANNTRVHLGLGSSNNVNVESVRIMWPGSNTPQILSSPGLNTLLKIKQDS